MTIFFLMFCVLFLMAASRTFLRTGLKGELLRIAGIIIFLFSYSINNIILGIVGFITFNIGWIILVTIELDKRREVYRQTTFLDRLIGNVPLMRDEKVFAQAYKPIIGILTGICCILIALIIAQRLPTFNILEIIYIGLLVFAGIFFIVYSLIKRRTTE